MSLPFSAGEVEHPSMAGKKKRNALQERLAAEAARKAAIRRAWRLKKVYGRAGTPPEGPSTSVRTVGGGGFESNRRRH
ncbi:MAG: hypothetical protein LBV60_19660 [Streptomyces sp.]|jgi:hypothetical protein|nr:hypothetical protein [Streptomyces sp.]